MQPEVERKPYVKPEIIYDIEMETRAGSAIGLGGVDLFEVPEEDK